MKSFTYYLAGIFFGLIMAIPFVFELPGFVPPLLALSGVCTLLVAASLPRPYHTGGFLYAATVRMQKVESRLLRSRIDSLRAVIAFYGSRSFYTTGAARRDMGTIARRALQYDDTGRSSSTALKLPNGED